MAKSTKSSKPAATPLVVQTAGYRDPRFLHNASGSWCWARGACYVQDVAVVFAFGDRRIVSIAGSSLYLWSDTGELLAQRDIAEEQALRVDLEGERIVVGPQKRGFRQDSAQFQVFGVTAAGLEPQQVITVPLEWVTAYALDFRLRGSTLVVADGNQARTFELSTGNELNQLVSPLTAAANNGVALSPDGARVAFVQWESGEVSIHTVSDGNRSCSFQSTEMHESFGIQCAFSNDGRLLATTSGRDTNRRLLVWDTTTGAVVHSLNNPATGTIIRVGFTPDATRVVLCCAGVDLLCWELQQGQLQWHRKTDPSPALVSIASSGRALLALSGRLYDLDLATGQTTSRYDGLDSPAQAVHQGSGTVIAQGTRRVFFLDAATKKLRHVLPGAGFHCSSSGVVLRTDGDDCGVWRAEPDGSNARQILHGKYAAALLVGDQVVTTDTLVPRYARIRLWDRDGGAQGELGKGAPEFLAAFPDGRRLLTVTKGKLELWDVLSRTVVASVPKAHRGRVTHCAFDESAFAIADEKTARVWSNSAEPLGTVKLEGELAGVQFTQAHQLLLAYRSGLLVLVTATGEERARYELDKRLSALGTLANGQLLLGLEDIGLAVVEVPRPVAAAA